MPGLVEITNHQNKKVKRSKKVEKTEIVNDEDILDLNLVSEEIKLEDLKPFEFELNFIDDFKFGLL